VLEKRQKWNIDEKLNQLNQYKGNFLQELTANGLFDLIFRVFFVILTFVKLEFNVAYIQRTGFTKPILIKNKRDLNLRVPTSQFSVHDVRKCIGSQRIIDVVNVETQQSMQMTMKSWAEYYDEPKEKRSKLLNVISLEVSHTNLDKYVESPSIVCYFIFPFDLIEFHDIISKVREIDWISNAWPTYWQDVQAHYQTYLKQEHMYYPKTRKYCLMSVAKCFTDFHIDMGKIFDSQIVELNCLLRWFICLVSCCERQKSVLVITTDRISFTFVRRMESCWSTE